MSTTVLGTLCFGIMFDEGYEFPWTSKEWEYDFETWYLFAVMGFESTKKVYDNYGNILEGVTEEDVDHYFEELKDFRGKNHCPFKLVNYQSHSFPAYIIALKNSVKNARIGEPLCLSNEAIPMEIDYLVIGNEAENVLYDFCDSVGLKLDAKQEAAWYLTVFYGV